MKPLCLLILLSGCMNGVGSGAVVVRLREVPVFSGVAVQSGLNARMTIGPRALVVRTDDNLQDRIETEVQNGVLIIRAKGAFAPTYLEVTIAAPLMLSVDGSDRAHLWGEIRTGGSFQAIASGGSELSLVGLDTLTFRADASGNSRVMVAGIAEQALMMASGGSHLTIDGVPAQTVSIDLRDGSTGRVRASDAVRGALSQGSHLAVFGNPGRRDVSVSGASSVSY
jgi:hypothetical protein